jgi:hypothetical protein
VLIALTNTLPVGTNVALLHVLWALLSGALLPQRGALIPALKGIGLSDQQTRRAWAAFRKGSWQIGELLTAWRGQIESLADWTVHRHEGYRAVAVDVTAFWRPALKNCPSQHFHPAAGRALPAVIIGLVAEVGELNGQHLASPRAIERVHPQDPGEARLWQTLLHRLKRHLTEDEIAVMDAGVKLRDVQAVGLERYVLRLPTNFTARRNVAAPYRGKGRVPIYGERVRPLPRTHKGKTIPSTPPDYSESWTQDGRRMTAHVWENLLLPGVVPHEGAPTFRVYAIHDPAYRTPWLLATPLTLQPITLKAIYADRWPVEQIPLAAKQMLGAHRQFVHADESIQRLPELALLVGSILSFLAATFPVMPTGFWDKAPKRTPGRFRRILSAQPFPQSYPLPNHFRKKESFTAHLPKGMAAVRSRIPRLPHPSSMPPNLSYTGFI